MGRETGPGSEPLTWDSLNQRQKLYITAIYHADQETESEERTKWSRGGRPRPAIEWRWMIYATLDGYDTPVKRSIRATKMIDEGTGSTFEALAKRKLIMVRYDVHTYQGRKILSNEPIPSIQITREGRALVRRVLGIGPSTQEVVGTLQEWHWQALAYAYAYVHERGDMSKSRIGWKTWLRLRDYQIASVERPLVTDSLQITPFGKAFYERAYPRYSQFYAEILAPAPQFVVDPHEPFTEVVPGQRICYACRGHYMVAITRTYRQSLKWTWSVEEKAQRTSETVASPYGLHIELCSCLETDIQESCLSLPELLSRLTAQEWQVAFPYHYWYSLDYFVGGPTSSRELRWYEPSLAQEKLLPLFNDISMTDTRNVMKDENLHYFVNESVGRGGLYTIFQGKLNPQPMVLTQRKDK